MCVVQSVYLFILLLPLLSANIQHFINPKYSRHKKCCPREHYFAICRDNLACITVFGQRLEVAEDTVADSSECIEVLKTKKPEVLVVANQNDGTFREVTDYIAYPKCCPLNKNYDMAEHKCVPGKINGFQGSGLFVTIGLQRCNFSGTVIVDYVNISSHLDESLRLRLENGKSALYGMYCFDVDDKSGSSIVRMCENYSDICRSTFESSGAPCLRKCCADGEVFSGASGRCYTTYDSGITVLGELRFKNFISTNFGIIQGTTGPLYKATSDHLFYVNSWGELRIRVINHWHSHISQDAPYCIETVVEEKLSKQEYFLIANDFIPKNGIRYVGEIFTQISLNISIFFLFVTIWCLYLLSDAHNLHSKCLIMYCVCDMLLYISAIASSSWHSYGMHYLKCYLLLYFGMGTLSWLNVLCADIWLAFRRLNRGHVNQNVMNKGAKYKFIYCCLYGWGFPTVFALLVFIIWKTGCVPLYYQPVITNSLCLKTEDANNCGYFIYVTFPYITLTFANIIFLLLTAIYYKKGKRGINKIRDLKQSRRVKYQDSINNGWERTTSISKLFLMTGILKTADLISFDLDWTKDYLTTWLHIVWSFVSYMSDKFSSYDCKYKLIYRCLHFPHPNNEEECTASTNGKGFYLVENIVLVLK